MVSIFRTEKTWSDDAANIYESIKRIGSYIKNHPADKNLPSGDFIPVFKSLWKLIETIYTSKWDVLTFEKEVSLTIWKCVRESTMPFYRKQESLTSNSTNLKGKSNSIISLSSTAVPLPSTTNLPVAPSSNKNVESVKKALKPLNMRKYYVQASKSNILSNIEDVLQVKEAFPSLLADEVGKMLKAKNSGVGNKKPKINITTRKLLRKEVIIPMAKSNTELIVNSAHTHISNVNKCLKNSKSDIVVDFIQITNNRIIITMNKLANMLNLSTIKKFLKNINNVNLDSIEGLYLPKSKSYMKIVRLPYKIKQRVITPNYIEGILKEIHLFKDIVLASKLHVIKASPKSDIAVFWVDIWDSQSGSLAKNIINHCFNIG